MVPIPEERKRSGDLALPSPIMWYGDFADYRPTEASNNPRMEGA